MVHYYINKHFSPVYFSPNRYFLGKSSLTTSTLALKKWISFYFWAKISLALNELFSILIWLWQISSKKSAKNAAKKFQIEDDFYCQNTAGPKKTFWKAIFMTARVTAFEFKNKTMFKMSHWQQFFQALYRLSWYWPGLHFTRTDK